MQKALEALTEVRDLIGESQGVYGLHLNGDPSPWEELEAGGRFERLTSLDEATEALTVALGVPVVPECETCHGEGTIDERLGGYSFSNPAATCPDCNGTGEGPSGVTASTRQADGQQTPMDAAGGGR